MHRFSLVFLVLALACTSGATARPTSRKLADAACASSYGQCGGTSCQATGCPSISDSAWTCCPSGFSCQRQSQYYWQCLTGNSSALPSSPVPSSSAHSSPSALSAPAQSSSSPSASAGTSSPQGPAIPAATPVAAASPEFATPEEAFTEGFASGFSQGFEVAFESYSCSENTPEEEAPAPEGSLEEPYPEAPEGAPFFEEEAPSPEGGFEEEPAPESYTEGFAVGYAEGFPEGFAEAAAEEPSPELCAPEAPSPEGSISEATPEPYLLGFNQGFNQGILDGCTFGEEESFAESSPEEGSPEEGSPEEPY